MNEYTSLLKKTLLLHKDEYVDYLKAFVSIDTRDIGHGIQGGYEAKGQEYLETIFKKAGVDNVVTEAMAEEPIQKAMDQYNEGNPGHNYENRYNLYGFFTGQHEKSIMFNGHIDTLPPENEESWSFPPLSSFIKDGRIYGLGVCDMKAGLMAAALSLKLLKDSGIPLPCKVIISSVCDEEGGGNGSIVAAMGGLKADAVVVCEPTTRELILAHMGWVFFQVEVSGIAVHSGLKKDGINAIDKAYKLIKAIDELEHHWLLTYKHPLLPPPSSNVGVIQGGDAGSTVPNYCVFKTCVHYHPVTMNHEKVVHDYMHAIELCCDGDDYLRKHRPKVTVYQSGGSFEMNRDHPLVACFTGAYKNFFDTPVTIAGSPAGCDSRTWAKIAGCPTIQYGPGALHQSHAADEYVEVQDYLDAILLYAGLILSWGSIP
jgi:acetylornithine deacetylase